MLALIPYEMVQHISNNDDFSTTILKDSRRYIVFEGYNNEPLLLFSDNKVNSIDEISVSCK
jgi:hypothetical protein